MSRLRGTLGPIGIQRQHAAIVGALLEARIEQRFVRSPLVLQLPFFKGGGFDAICDLGRKLRAGANRKRQTRALIVLHTVRRTEARAGFHWLACYRHPDVPDAYLTTEQQHAVDCVLRALTKALMARPGPSRLTQQEAEQRIREDADPETSDNAPTVEKSFINRLKRRRADHNAKLSTPLVRLPAWFLALLAPPEISL